MSGPNPNVFESRKFSVNRLGPSSEFTGISVSIAFNVLYVPNPGTVTIGPPAGPALSDGRWLYCALPIKSWLKVMLYGDPDCAIMKGLNRMPHGIFTEPPRKNRLRTSNDERP